MVLQCRKCKPRSLTLTGAVPAQQRIIVHNTTSQRCTLTCAVIVQLIVSNESPTPTSTLMCLPSCSKHCTRLDQQQSTQSTNSSGCDWCPRRPTVNHEWRKLLSSSPPPPILTTPFFNLSVVFSFFSVRSSLGGSSSASCGLSMGLRPCFWKVGPKGNTTQHP